MNPRTIPADVGTCIDREGRPLPDERQLRNRLRRGPRLPYFGETPIGDEHGVHVMPRTHTAATDATGATPVALPTRHRAKDDLRARVLMAVGFTIALVDVALIIVALSIVFGRI